MKKCVFVSVVLIVFLTCSCAMAADPASFGCNYWTGFYAGVNVGTVVNDSSYKLTPTGNYLALPAVNPYRTDSGDLSSGAFTGGAQAGYNWQCGCFVLGLEADINYNGVEESQYVNRPFPLVSTLTGNFIHTVTEKVDFFDTLRLRLGWTPTNRILLYLTGGLASGEVSTRSYVNFTGGSNFPLSGSQSDLQIGWTVGGGLEYALSKCWSVKFEYLFVDLGSKSYTYYDTTGLGYSYTTQLDSYEHVIRVGLNYKF